jgi:hypothetical protein
MFEEILSQIGVSLSSHNLPYMVVGGQAVLLYGEPRLARDREDLRAILLKNPAVDLLYIRKWLKQFDESSEEKDFLKTFEGMVRDL